MNANRLASRRSFLKTAGVAALGAPFFAGCLTARPRRTVLRHASFGASNMAWADLQMISGCPGVEVVAVCDVDLTRTSDARQAFPRARVYQDWRELLDREAKNIDSVNVSIPDHMHAPVGISAMQLGKHVYGQKPLAHDLYEVRRMTEVARRQGVVTQMGIQIHSSAEYRRAVRVIQDGVIGRVKEVHTWSDKTWGDPSPRPDRNDPVPAGFDWDLWLGGCAARPFIGDEYYHPANWRKRLDFGTGTFGDMGCHILDPVFNSLKLRAPVSVRSEGPAPNQWNWAVDAKIHYQFAGTKYTAGEVLPLTWYDGAQKPPPEIAASLPVKNLPEQGSVFIGTEGFLLLPHIGWPRLFPAEKYHGYTVPEVAGANHWEQFVNACLGRDQTTAHFGYAGPLTEAVLLGGVASRFPQTTLQWNSAKLTFDLPAANAFVRRSYRPGWRIHGLA